MFFGQKPQISSEQKIAQAEAEIDMVSDMYSRYAILSAFRFYLLRETYYLVRIFVCFGWSKHSMSLYASHPWLPELSIYVPFPARTKWMERSFLYFR